MSHSADTFSIWLVIRSKVLTVTRCVVFWVALWAPFSICAAGETLRVTTWNLEWFPDKSLDLHPSNRKSEILCWGMRYRTNKYC